MSHNNNNPQFSRTVRLGSPTSIFLSGCCRPPWVLSSEIDIFPDQPTSPSGNPPTRAKKKKKKEELHAASSHPLVSVCVLRQTTVFGHRPLCPTRISAPGHLGIRSVTLASCLPSTPKVCKNNNKMLLLRETLGGHHLRISTGD